MDSNRVKTASGESRFSAIVGSDMAPKALAPQPLRFMRTLMDVQGLAMPSIAMENEHALPSGNEHHHDAGTGKWCCVFELSPLLALVERDAIRARIGILHSLEIIQAHPEFSQQGVAQILELACAMQRKWCVN
jgi:hypothetical protein